MSVPYHVRLDPDQKEDRGFAEADARSRGSEYLSITAGHPGRLYICKPGDYELSTVNRNSRGKVRKALDRFEVCPVEKRQFAAEGLELNHETFRSSEPLRSGTWQPRFVGKIRRGGLCVTGSLRSWRVRQWEAHLYSVGCRDGGWINVLYRMSRNQELKRGCNWALDYLVLTQAGSDRTVAGVTNGFTSPLTPAGVHQYKMHLGYRVEEHTMGIQLHPLLEAVFCNSVVRACTRALDSWTPANKRTALAFDLIRGAQRTSRLLLSEVVSADLVEEASGRATSCAGKRQCGLWPLPHLLSRFLSGLNFHLRLVLMSSCIRRCLFCWS